MFPVFKIVFVYFLIMIIPAKSSIQQNSAKIERWAEQLSFEVNNALEKNFGLATFQSLIKQALCNANSVHGSEFLNNISVAVDGKLQDVLRTLISNKFLIESESLQKGPTIKAVNCCGSSANLRDNARFRNNYVDRNLSCVISTGVNSYLTESLEVNYKRNVLSSKAIKWQYFGSSQGSYHQYPSSEYHCSDEGVFDPRLSSWYVNAAMTARKRLVIIIDKSGSMRKSSRMILAKDAAHTVLNTLTPDDYVTAVAFSSSTSSPPGCFRQKLAKATASNIKVLREWINNLKPEGWTQYSLAFKTAFDCFINSTSMGKGKNIILFLTDGKPSDKSQSEIYDSTAKGQEQMNNTVTILTYGLGTGISQNNATTILTKIATQNRGHFTLIQDGSREKLNSALGSYYKYFVKAGGNVALGKQANQSSVMLNQVPDRAVDGYVDGKCSLTNYDDDPWLRVDLEDEYNVMAVVITNCCKNILRNVEIRIGNNENGKFNKICGYLHYLKDKEDRIIQCSSDISGRFVHLSLEGRNKSLSICEVRVFQVPAPSLTFSMPCTTENGTMFGVTAVEMSLSEVFSGVFSFSYGQYSYAIVIDVEGRVWIHPRSPNPDESTLGPSLLPLEIYEPWATKNIMKTVLNQPSGQIRLKKILLQFPRGYSSADGMKTMEVNGTIHWRRLRNMFILMVVIVENDFNIWLVHSQDNKQQQKLSEKFDKNVDNNLGVCQVNGNPFFTQLSTVKLALRRKQAGANNTMEQDFFVGEKPADKMLNKLQVSHPSIVSDVVITGYLEKNWRKSDMEDDGSVMWRYIGTESGVYRRYPGFTLTENVDYKNRPWYRQAVMNPDKSILSHSFADPYGRGHVISITKAVLKDRLGDRCSSMSNWQTRVVGVAGIDMTFSSFHRMAINVMPGCFNEYDCYLMDRGGYLFVNLNEREAPVHVTEKFSWIGKQFVETLQILKPSWCNDLLDFKIHLSYEAVITDTVISQTPLDCRQYMLVPLPNVSSSLLVLPSRRVHKNCQDKLFNGHFEACHSSPSCKSCSSNVTVCQTPCSCPMLFDRCSNWIKNTFTSITCPAPTLNSSLVNPGLSDNEFLNSTNVPVCENVCNIALNNDECSKISNCTWCESILSSCENFCPFNRSQRIGLKFTLDLAALLPALTDNVKTDIEKNLQQTMYKVLGEKLENNIVDVKFKQKSITMTVKGSTMNEIYDKLKKMIDVIQSRKFAIDIPEHNGRNTVHPKQLYVLDLNECLTNVHDCHVNATCIDTDDFYNCSCNSGFTGNGRNCTDINECDRHPCREYCTNIPGSFKCSCYNGYTGDGFLCLDINECDQSPCHDNATCMNQIGSFQCSCLEGFSGNGSHCSDVNECDQSPCHDNATCINQIGSFQCLCVERFSGNGFQCQDINECEQSGCHDNATCLNHVGSFQCSCLEGFSGNGSHCQDINECDLTPCHSNASCTNVPGSFKCSCFNGYSGDGFHCHDVNECERSPCHDNATCINQIGSFQCFCLEGFTGNGSHCQDQNECEEMACHPNATCTNTKGSYHCACFRGFSGNGTFCREAEITETSGTTPTVISSSEKGDVHHSTTTVIVLVVTSFIVGISFGLCCIWFVLLRRKQSKNKVRPSTSSGDDVEVYILRLERNENVAFTINKNNRNKSSSERRKSRVIKPRKSFQVASNVPFQLSEVEI